MSTAFVATKGLETAPIQDGSVLFDPKSGKFIMLNRSAACLWTGLTAPRTQEELVRVLGASYPDAAIPAGDVNAVLEHLQQLELVAPSAEGAAASVARTDGKAVEAKTSPYEPPSLKVLDEEELLKIFQMTAAEISVASCWWGSCPTGCP